MELRPFISCLIFLSLLSVFGPKKVKLILVPELGRTLPPNFFGALILKPDFDDSKGKPDFRGESVDCGTTGERFRHKNLSEDGQVRVRDACALAPRLLPQGELVAGGVKVSALKIINTNAITESILFLR